MFEQAGSAQCRANTFGRRQLEHHTMVLFSSRGARVARTMRVANGHASAIAVIL
jgi:hypothetical protein